MTCDPAKSGIPIVTRNTLKGTPRLHGEPPEAHGHFRLEKLILRVPSAWLVSLVFLRFKTQPSTRRAMRSSSNLKSTEGLSLLTCRGFLTGLPSGASRITSRNSAPPLQSAVALILTGEESGSGTPKFMSLPGSMRNSPSKPPPPRVNRKIATITIPTTTRLATTTGNSRRSPPPETTAAAPGAPRTILRVPTRGNLGAERRRARVPTVDRYS